MSSSNSGVLKYVLLSAFFSKAASALALTNMTLPLPIGTTNHDTPGLICTPMEWTDLVGFYLFNYVAHAATVLTRPGERAWDFAVTVFGSLLFPALGLYRGMDAIFSGAVFCRDELRKAARSSALCCVVRSSDWEPKHGDTFENAVLRPNPKPAESEKSKGEKEETASARVLTYAPPWILSKFGFPIYVHRQIIHGAYSLPDGYCFATVPYDVQFVPPPNDTTRVEIAATYNLVKALVALCQTVYACITLYRARGNQIEQFGYAAFGLTVAPYAVMSIVNLAGNLCRPEYACLYMVESDIMDEARSRGGFFHGSVARVEEEPIPTVCNPTTLEAEDIEDLYFSADNTGQLISHFSTAKITPTTPTKPPNGAPDPEEKICKSPTSISSTSTLSGSHTIPLSTKTPTCPHTLSDTVLLIPSCNPLKRSSSPQTLSTLESSLQPHTIRTTYLCKPDCFSRNTIWTLSWIHNTPQPSLSLLTPRLLKYLLTLFIALLPLLINGILSHFTPGSLPPKETGTWKSYTLQWLCFGAVGGLWWVLDQESKDASVRRVIWFGPKTRATAYFFSSSPAIGGFIVVGQMYGRFGDCTWVGG